MENNVYYEMKIDQTTQEYKIDTPRVGATGRGGASSHHKQHSLTAVDPQENASMKALYRDHESYISLSFFSETYVCFPSLQSQNCLFFRTLFVILAHFFHKNRLCVNVMLWYCTETVVSGLSGSPTEEDLREELCDTFTPELAHTAYVMFCRLAGGSAPLITCSNKVVFLKTKYTEILY